jgi:2-haloacid dehalogenase
MNFDLILTSNITGYYKPNKETYITAIKALDLPSSQIAMVAAHAYDLDAAATQLSKVFPMNVLRSSR